MKPLPASNFDKAIQDLVSGFKSAHIWTMLGWQEIRLRYRRSTLGPIWLTLSTGVLIGGMGPLYSRLLGLDLASYLPYLAVGFIVWLFLSSLMVDACTVFITSEGMIKQLKMPLSVYVLRVVWKDLIIFFHNLLIVAVVLMFFPPQPGWHLLLIPLGIVAIALNGIWAGIVLGMLCARFRDIPQLVQSVVQVMFFLTPVMWRADSLGEHRWAADWNPIYHLLEGVRAPLLGQPLQATTYVMIIAVTVAGYTMALLLLARFRARVAYWV